ncbi:serine hydrolase [Devosia sp. PTR5]|uniref:Serine hydrolase n=1 Tax=Devosia oryzisoli TaxID=2774138 RepID=A0A927ISE0_9HYPH|nr:serine hydrolase [Devosia oryzisoli]MBD8064621.1 serine hydrolase [Devosia oryzisoli]
MLKLSLFLAASLLFPAATVAQESPIDAVLERASGLDPLETVIVAVDGEVVAAKGYAGHSPDEPTNIKSASKSIISALVGIAIDKGLLSGVDQKVSKLLPDDLPDDPDPRLAEVTVGNLLSMQAGLEPTSGPNYGRWIASDNWVRAALGRPFIDDPGGRMLYSTGSTHLLSAILTKVGGKSTLALAKDWLAPLEGFAIAGWEQDSQGIYLGGNEMAMSPMSLLAFGELYRAGGRTPEGMQLVSPDWIEQSWTRRTTSRFNNDGYGYGWFLRRIGGEEVRYAWGYGGQMLYIVPSLELSVVMTSDATAPSAGTGHRDALMALMGAIIDVVRDEAAPAPAEAGGD